jgi:hypothetical protein
MGGTGHSNAATAGLLEAADGGLQEFLIVDF